MIDKRSSTRRNRRLQLRYGPDEPHRIGFTCDLSSRGFFIQTALVVRPGTLLEIEIVLPEEIPVRLRGRVQWAKKVPPNLLSKVRKGGMGIRIIDFVSGQEAYLRYCEELETV
ncbi:MAG: PilZ domain-containing protein [Syntrophotaleaceae bacterium]